MFTKFLIEKSTSEKNLKFKKKLFDKKIKFIELKLENDEKKEKILKVGNVVKTEIIKNENIYSLIATIEFWHMVSNTLLDKHNEKMTREALIQVEKNLKNCSLPIFKEHDFKNPPIGKWINAKVVDFENESYLFAKLEIFTEKNLGVIKKSKEMKIDIPKKNTISFDRNFTKNKYLNELIKNELMDDEEKLNLEVKNIVKKSFEFTPEIIISFAVVAVASGFFNSLGNDLYTKLKMIIKKSFLEMKTPPKELHTIFINYFTLPDNEVIEIKTIFILDQNYQEIDIFSIQPFLKRQLQQIIEKKLPIRGPVRKTRNNNAKDFPDHL
ncbi:MAG: hypothetical protein ACRC8M_07380 [Cetobacterium sp.]|uniref:hypothetical protein n=1 Tax=Cetobacterium sp. TaxID=2071632 RepID=UPI003F3AC9FC